MIRGFFDLLAKMGLSVRDDPPKILDLSVREFGEARAGLALSICQIVRDDSAALPTVSVVFRNVSGEPKTIIIPGWLGFYHFDVRLPNRSPMKMTPFGRALAQPERQNARLEVSLAAGAWNEAEVPLGSIFSLRAGGKYVVQASCEPFAGVMLQSNEIFLT